MIELLVTTGAHLIAPCVTTTAVILAPITSSMATFWYWLTNVHLENGCWNGERVKCKQ